MTQKFKFGDLVELKSGGPTMTVADFSTDHEYATCNWFAGKKLEEYIFHQDSLQLVKPISKK